MTERKQECFDARDRPADIRRRIAERDRDGDIMAIIADAGDRFNVTVDEILGWSRVRAISHARDQVFACLYAMGHMTPHRIGMLFGRSHTAVFDAAHRHMARMGQ